MWPSPHPVIRNVPQLQSLRPCWFLSAPGDPALPGVTVSLRGALPRAGSVLVSDQCSVSSWGGGSGAWRVHLGPVETASRHRAFA